MLRNTSDGNELALPATNASGVPGRYIAAEQLCPRLPCGGEPAGTQAPLEGNT